MLAACELAACAGGARTLAADGRPLHSDEESAEATSGPEATSERAADPALAAAPPTAVEARVTEAHVSEAALQERVAKRSEYTAWLAEQAAARRAEAWVTAPWEAAWNNSIALCCTIKEQNMTDVREWLQYHKCVRHASDESRHVPQCCNTTESAGDLMLQRPVPVGLLTCPVHACGMCVTRGMPSTAWWKLAKGGAVVLWYTSEYQSRTDVHTSLRVASSYRRTSVCISTWSFDRCRRCVPALLCGTWVWHMHCAWKVLSAVMRCQSGAMGSNTKQTMLASASGCS